MHQINLGAAIMLLVAAFPAQGATQLDSIDSCYRKAGIERAQVPPSRHLFVFIDQTTVLDESLKRSVHENVRRNLQLDTGDKPLDTAFTIATFSAYLGDRYTSVDLAGTLDSALTTDEAYTTNKTKLKTINRCLSDQLSYARKLVDAALDKGFGSASKDIAKSDVLASLKDFADHNVAASPAKVKIVLLVSDMLENSTVTSFYSKRAVRRIDPSAEMKKVKDKQLVGTFAGASVYVLGAGLLNTSDGYRDPDTMSQLEAFWTQYFRSSNAKLVEMGKPALLRSVE